MQISSPIAPWIRRLTGFERQSAVAFNSFKGLQVWRPTAAAKPMS
jgi:hypothetical protein